MLHNILRYYFLLPTDFNSSRKLRPEGKMIELQCILAGLLLLLSVTAAALSPNLWTTEHYSMLNNGAAAPDCTSSTSSSRYQPLVCWLNKAKLNLPDESFQEGMFTVVSSSTVMIYDLFVNILSTRHDIQMTLGKFINLNCYLDEISQSKRQ